MYKIEGKRIWVAGHNGMVGRAVVRALEQSDCTILKVDRNDVDLKRQLEVEAWMKKEKPDAVIICAAKVGGILANHSYPADFIYENLMIETNIIHTAFLQNIEKLIFLGSSCIYPKFANQPISEEELLTGSLEPTNEWYALAKIAGVKLCQAYQKQHGCEFISAMPTNLYGPFDNYNSETSHVIPALLNKIHHAKINNINDISIWGSGKPMREFLYVDDCAEAILFLLKYYDGTSHINIGTGKDLPIHKLVSQICELVGFEGNIIYDTSMPDGTPKKQLDVSKLTKLGWTSKTKLKCGLEKTYEHYKQTMKTS